MEAQAAAKQTMRQRFRRLRAALAPEERATRSAAICARAAALTPVQGVRVVHAYLPMRAEVDTRPLLLQALAQGQRVVVPIVEGDKSDLAHSWLASLAADDLVAGAFGTLQPRRLQPAAPGDWDVIMVPLLAFDRAGYRLGYGGGYYDRLLSRATPAALPPVPTIGLAFALQEADRLPHEPHDIPLDWIVTEDEVIAAARNRL